MIQEEGTLNDADMIHEIGRHKKDQQDLSQESSKMLGRFISA